MEQVIPYCDLHNRDKVRSKYPDKRTGEIGYYCPECYAAWKDKQKQQPPKTDGGGIILDELQSFRKEVMEALRKIWTKLDK